MGSYHSKEFEDFKNEGIYEHIQKYPYMSATGVAVHNIPTPEGVRYIDIYTDKNWNYLEVRVYFTAAPDKYLEANGTTDSPLAYYLKENFTDEYNPVQKAYGHINEETGDGFIFFNTNYLDGTFDEYVDHIVYPLAEKVVEHFN